MSSIEDLQKKAHAINLMKRVNFFIKKSNVLSIIKKAQAFQDQYYDDMERYGGYPDYGSAFVNGIRLQNKNNTVIQTSNVTQQMLGGGKNQDGTINKGLLAPAYEKYVNGTYGQYSKGKIMDNFKSQDGKWLDADKATESYKKLVEKYPGLDPDPTWWTTELWHTGKDDLNYRVRKMNEAINTYNREHPENTIDTKNEFVPLPG